MTNRVVTSLNRDTEAVWKWIENFANEKKIVEFYPKQIAKQVGIKEKEALKALVTLEKEGYITQIEENTYLL